MSWFCHGLEERIKGAEARSRAIAALQDVVRWRAVLGALLEDPEGALRTLRTSTRRVPSAPPRPSTRPDDEQRTSFPPGDEATIRVSAASVDRLLDRVESIDLVRDRVLARGEAASDVARSLRELRGKLVEALRLIGPPRPWGAPAAALRRIEDVVSALGPIGEEVEGAAGGLRGAGLSLRDGVTEAKKQLSAMRQTPVGRIFARLGTAIEAEARRSERALIVRTRGADETIDRRLAEQLVDPCLQLVRNAVAHGIEPAAAREAAGKPASGTISLTARKVGSRLSLAIQDDGAGVDVDRVRERAIESGTVTRDLAEAADDDTLLTLLFLPGFSTRDKPDLLAGRGIGLDIARSAVQRLGGTIHLSSRAGAGLSARIDVPIESGLTSVLWVDAGGEEYAVPVASTLGVRVVEPRDEGKIPHLAACLEMRPSERARYALSLDVLGDAPASDTVSIGVDRVGRVEELLVRPLGSLVAGLGPYAGAIARGDGTLRLAIDAQAIAPRARALVRGIERASDAPRSMR
jgi:two-component system chemotaxis sensor kinase CheA